MRRRSVIANQTKIERVLWLAYVGEPALQYPMASPICTLLIQKQRRTRDVAIFWSWSSWLEYYMMRGSLAVQGNNQYYVNDDDLDACMLTRESIACLPAS